MSRRRKPFVEQLAEALAPTVVRLLRAEGVTIAAAGISSPNREEGAWRDDQEQSRLASGVRTRTADNSVSESERLMEQKITLRLEAKRKQKKQKASGKRS